MMAEVKMDKPAMFSVIQHICDLSRYSVELSETSENLEREGAT